MNYILCTLSHLDTGVQEEEQGGQVEEKRSTPIWSTTHFDVFLKVNSPRFVGGLTPKLNTRLKSETIILLASLVQNSRRTHLGPGPFWRG